MSVAATKELTPDLFGTDEIVISKAGELTASAFRYRSGVAALRIRNSLGEMIVLPFHGQQVWDATFLGRRLTMVSMFDEPEDSQDYLSNYGGFFLHCGMVSMGNPHPGDDHPVHGELPNARYEQAQLEVATDASGRTVMTVTGTYTHRKAFTAGYVATPRVSLAVGSSVIEAELSVRNIRHAPLDIMYLAHVNFRLIDGARIVDNVPDNPETMQVRDDFPAPETYTPAHRALLSKVKGDLAHHRALPPGQRLSPELVIIMQPKGDKEGVVRGLQVLPDGTSDFISYSATELPFAVRWMTRNGDEEALGLLLPATAGPNGRNAARASGQMVSLPAGETWRCALQFGALDAIATEKMAAAIAG